MVENKYDIIIIGAGPTGISCAIEAQKAGIRYLLLEKGVLVNSIYHFPTNMTFFSTSKNLEVGEVPFISHSDKPTRKEALEYYRRLYDYYELNIRFNEEVKEIIHSSEGFEIRSKSSTHRSKYIIIATGYYGNAKLLNVPGENLKKVKHYYDEAHPYIGHKVIVVGGANSACDVALETWQKGAEVIMVVREPELYQKVKYWILPNIENRIKEGSIKAYFNSTIKEIKENEVIIDTPEGLLTLENDYVLAMTGYRPDYAMLQKFGLKFETDEDQIPVFDDETLECNVHNLFIAGVILGGMNTSKYFIENTRLHGQKIISEILEREQN